MVSSRYSAISCKYKRLIEYGLHLLRHRHRLHDDWLLTLQQNYNGEESFKGPIIMIKGSERFLYKNTLKSLGLQNLERITTG